MSSYTVEVNGERYTVTVREKRGTLLTFEVDGELYTTEVTPHTRSSVVVAAQATTSSNSASVPHKAPTISGDPSQLRAPIPGIVSDVRVTEGQPVQAGDITCVLEAMKMENPIKAHRSGTVTKVHITRGQEVAQGSLLISIDDS